MAARSPKTMDEWREFRRKNAANSAPAKAAQDAAAAEAARAERWARTVGASTAVLDGLSPARRAAFLDEWERDNPPPEPAPAPAVEDVPAAEVDVHWERRVQFEALRDGNALRQNDILGEALKREGGGAS